MGEAGVVFWVVCPFCDLMLPTTCPSFTPRGVGTSCQSECAPFYSDLVFTQNVNSISCNALSIFIFCDLKDNKNTPDMFLLSRFRSLASGDRIFHRGAIGMLVGKQVGQCAHPSRLPSGSAQFPGHHTPPPPPGR